MTGSLIFAAVIVACFAWLQTYRVGRSIFDRAGRRAAEHPGPGAERGRGRLAPGPWEVKKAPGESPRVPPSRVTAAPPRAAVAAPPRPAPARKAPGAERPFKLTVTGADKGRLREVWQQLCHRYPHGTPPDFNEIYPHVATFTGETFTFRRGDPDRFKEKMENVLYQYGIEQPVVTVEG